MAKEKDCFYSLDCLFSSQSDWIIQQFIGLYDKNDQEIYEGDIIKTDDSNWGYGGEYDEKNDGYLYVVVPGIDELLAGDELVNSFFDFVSVWHRYSEVVGNIYENPELLREKM